MKEKEDKVFSHLTRGNRLTIYSGINKKQNLNKIAAEIGKPRSTIQREIQRNRDKVIGIKKHRCSHTVESCPVKNFCKNFCIKRTCYSCTNVCGPRCTDYKEWECEKLQKAPYVCNTCKSKAICSETKYFYDPNKADDKYRETLKGSRSGANLDKEEIERLSTIFREGFKRGLSVYQIIVEEGGPEVLGHSERTIYNYIDQGILNGVDKISGPKRQYKKRKSSMEKVWKIDKKCLEHRKYEDLMSSEEFQDITPVQMDSVLGGEGDRRCLLTLHFPDCKFMLAFIRERNDAKSIENIFNSLEEKLGPETFRKLFPVILTDNGPEFSNPTAIEISHTL